MDWSKTKTVFIIVFSILNVFLYSLYLNRQSSLQNVQVLGKTSIEETLKLDNITYDPLPFVKKDASYISADMIVFTDDMTKKLHGQSVVVLDKTILRSQLKDTVSIKPRGDYYFVEFLEKYVLKGNEYMLWAIDEKERKAVFFQKVQSEPIYYSPNAMLIIHWNEEGLVTSYEQRALEEFVSFNRKKDLLSQYDALGTLASRGYLKQDSKVKHVNLGYSTLVQLTETQVFAPTWNVQVELKDGQIENYFINAIDGKVVEFQLEQTEEHRE